MSETFKTCNNCTHYNKDVSFCKRKGKYIIKDSVCDEYKEKILSINEVFEGTKKEIEQINDPVSHPSHYTNGNIEVIDYIEDKNFNFNLGNVVKYVSRAGKKDVNKTIEDLKKASWYLNREISTLEKNV